MRRTVRFLALLSLAFLAPECLDAFRPASLPTEVKLIIRATQPQRYSLRVALNSLADYPVAADGCVRFTVPSFNHDCDVYLLDAIKVRDGASEDVRLIELRRDGRAVCKLSLTEIGKLASDDAGYCIVRVED